MALARAAELPQRPMPPRPPPSPSPPPPEPTPVPEIPMPKMAEQLELLVEDPRPSEPTLPPISRAAVMLEQIGELAADASVQSKVEQRFAPSEIVSELLGVCGSELRHLSPEQFVMEQQHLLMSDTLQASISENAAAESAAGSIAETQKLFHLASIEQPSPIVGAIQQTLAESPMFSELEKMSEPNELEEFSEMLEAGEEGGSEQSVFDIDLGAFELVDSGITAEELLTNEDPVIYHKDLPVHSVHHDTVQTEAAIENLMNATPSMLSTQVPPTMVADNYCFAVDGDRIQMADILGDDQWWKHTSRPTKYFYSKDLRRFYRVQCLAVRGRIISARLANTTPAMGGGGTGDAMAPEMQLAIAAAALPGGGTSDSFSMPLAFRRSMTFAGGARASLASAQPASSESAASGLSALQTSPNAMSVCPRGAFRLGQAHAPHLPHSFTNSNTAAANSSSSHKGAVLGPTRNGARPSIWLTFTGIVVRFYSFWRTCTSFHRIVTMIERVGHSPAADQRRSPSRTRGTGGTESYMHHQQLHPAASTSSATASESPSSSIARGDSLGRSPRGPPDFQKRLFVQYLWRNAKPSDKARVQREFDPRRQRLLKYVTDTAARKRMTSAKVQFRSGSAGTSTDKTTKWSHQTPPGSATVPFSTPSIRWRLPPGASASAGAPSPNLSPTHTGRRRPHSAGTALLRRTRTDAEMCPKK